MNNVVAEAIEKGQILGSLSGSAILALVAIALGWVAWQLFKTQQETVLKKFDEQIRNVKEVKEGIKENNIIAKEQVTSLKDNNANMVKFIELHCANAESKLGKIDADLKELNEKIGALSHTRSERVNRMIKEQEG